MGRKSAVSHLKPEPLCLIAQAFRDTAFDTTELEILTAHLDLWQSLLAKHGVVYDPVLLDGASKEQPNLIFHYRTNIDARKEPAALSLVLDALYELSTQLAIDFQVHVVEPVVTRLIASASESGYIPDRRVFTQQVQGARSLEEEGPAADVFSAMLVAALGQPEEEG